ncbi:MAG: hypothetical protein PHI59_00410 [Candidatus Omnitrophica bacterium]|nr:hypothetical protein [Candidatus Omnitrophota bacterium]
MNRKGIALIMAVGVLAILATIATSFALNMRLEYRAAVNYSNGVKARYFAEAALQRAIAELRTHVKSSAFDNLDEDWALDTHPTNDASLYNNHSVIESDKEAAPPRITSNGSSYVELISDEQRKVNINTANTLLLSNIVSRVFTAWDATAVNTFVSKITGHIPCNDLNELIMDKPFGSSNHIEKADLDTLRPFITVNSYRDPNCVNRAPININTCEPEVLYSVFRRVEGDIGGPVNSTQAGALASAVISARPITNWSDFNNVVNTGIADTKRRAAVKDNCNPNRTKPSTGSTTEFCFNSGGYYTVTATGTVMDLLNVSLASRTLSATVKLYDIYCETTKEQFELGTPVRVTWFDSCPVVSEKGSFRLFDSYNDTIPSDVDTVDDSLKLGYWDNFDEDAAYSTANWANTSGNPINSKYQISDYNSTGNWNIHPDFSVSQPQYMKCTLSKAIPGGGNSWTVQNFSLRMREADYGMPIAPMSSLLKRAGQLLITRTTGAGLDIVVLEGKQNPLEWSGNFFWNIPNLDASGNPDGTFKLDTVHDSLHFEGLSDTDARNYNTQGFVINLENIPGPVPGTVTCKNIFDNQIRIWPDTNPTNSIYSEDMTEYYAVSTNGYAQIKTFSITRQGTTVSATRFAGSGTVGPVVKSDCFDDDAFIGLYCSEIYPCWDDIRMITPDGNLTSQPINSTLSPGMTGNVEWGTITGTLTIPSTASATETVTYQTKSSADGGTWKDASPTTGGGMTSIAGTSIQYKALLATTNATMHETPVLEDITITYLPKVQIRSYSLAQ